RLHTRLQGDWSSDVCSSDLAASGPTTTASPVPAGLALLVGPLAAPQKLFSALTSVVPLFCTPATLWPVIVFSDSDVLVSVPAPRSEERRVGKGIRAGWWWEC